MIYSAGLNTKAKASGFLALGHIRLCQVLNDSWPIDKDANLSVAAVVTVQHVQNVM